MNDRSPAAPPIRLYDEPGHLIRRAQQIAVAKFHDVHGRHVTPVQYAILRALHTSPGIDQVTLAEKVALDTSTTADIAARLEGKGWIHRDVLLRRQRSLTLTPAGETVLADMLADTMAHWEGLMSAFSPAEQQEFLRLLRKFVDLHDGAAPNP